jgi:2-polyprenyl-6-hydroxyphenyl methylase/3-demethylubiquinone-9 3-methyltransferase
MADSSEDQIKQGERFAFGDNWARFLKGLDQNRVLQAERSLQSFLGLADLSGLTFLDAGSGSGLSSLAARRLGAKVLSFDSDPQSVACTNELKNRFFANDSEWVVQQGSVLDDEFMSSLGQFDVVLSWGVLHHTGDMHRAMGAIIEKVKSGGLLYIAIYNDQGRTSRVWWHIKRSYVRAPKWGQWLLLGPSYVRLWGPTMVRDAAKLRPFQTWRNYSKDRGMSPHRDVIDWVGGFPFEVATPGLVTDFYEERGFETMRLKTCGDGIGCNEFVFRRR